MFHNSLQAFASSASLRATKTSKDFHPCAPMLFFDCHGIYPSFNNPIRWSIRFQVQLRLRFFFQHLVFYPAVFYLHSFGLNNCFDILSYFQLSFVALFIKPRPISRKWWRFAFIVMVPRLADCYHPLGFPWTFQHVLFHLLKPYLKCYHTNEGNLTS